MNMYVVKIKYTGTNRPAIGSNLIPGAVEINKGIIVNYTGLDCGYYFDTYENANRYIEKLIKEDTEIKRIYEKDVKKYDKAKLPKPDYLSEEYRLTTYKIVEYKLVTS